MVLELTVSLLLMVFCSVCIVNLFVNAASMMAYDPMGGIVWPVILCSLLVVLLAANAVRTAIKIRQAKGDEAVESTAEGKKTFVPKSIIQNKLVIGVAAMLLYAFLLEKIGFLFSTPLFIYAYMSLLGQKKVLVKIITAVVAAIALYVLFNGLLQVPLPRGYWIFRNISLIAESLL